MSAPLLAIDGEDADNAGDARWRQRRLGRRRAHLARRDAEP